MLEKLVCLDQCAWIALTNVYHNEHPFIDGRLAEKEHIQFVNEIIASRNNHKIFYPITYERQIETWRQMDPNLRIRLADFMVRLSGGLTFGPGGSNLIRKECNNYLIDQLHINAKKYKFPETLFGYGIKGLIGCDTKLEIQKNTLPADPKEEEEIRKKVTDFLDDPENMVKALSDSFDGLSMRDPFVDENDELIKKATVEMASNIRMDWEEIKKTGRDWESYRSERQQRFFWDIITPIMTDLSLELGITPDMIDSLPKKDFDDNFMSIRSAYVSSGLMIERDRKLRDIDDSHDINDVTFLSYTIPYSSAVVTDDKWEIVSSSSGVHRKFGTKVYNLREFFRSHPSMW